MKNLPDLELLSAYLDGELTADQQAYVERLLAASAEARQLLEDLRTVSQSLQGLPVYKLTEDLSPKILEEAQRRRQSALPAAAAPTLADRPATASEPGLTGAAPQAVESAQSPVLAGPAAPQAASEALPRPTDGWKTADAAAFGRERSGFGWDALFRRLFTARGIAWSATAVAVAVVLWWFGPATGPRIPEVAQAPKALDHLGEKADSEGRSLEESQTGWAGDVRRRAPTGAAIGARPAEAPSPEAKEAEEKTPGLADPLLAVKAPSTDRTPPSAPEAPSMAVRGGLPKAPPLAPVMAQPPLEENTAEIRGKRTLAASPSPSALNEAGKALAMGKGYGAGPARPEAPAAGSRASGGPSPAAVAAAQNAAGEREKVGALDAVPAPGGVGRPSAGPGIAPAEGMPEKQTAESEGKQLLRKAPELAMAAKPTAPPSEAGASAASAMAKKESAPSAAPEGVEKEEQDSALLIPDATMVVVCDLSGPALRQRSFEQILSSQQIAIHEGEEVLEEWAAQGRDRASRADDKTRGDAGASKPGPSEVVGKRERNQAEAKAAPAAPTEVSAEPPSQSSKIKPMEKGIAQSKASADQRAEGLARTGELPAQDGGFGRGLNENQLQLVLVEASPEQLEGTLKAMQARPEEFLSVSVSPAPAYPSQQMYQQYARAYRARGPLAGQARMGQLPPAGRSELVPEKNDSPSDKTLPAHAPPAPALAKPQAALESTKEKSLQESAPLPDAEQAGHKGAVLGRQDQQMFGPQARARRLRLPEHLSQQLVSSQQQAGQPSEQLRRQISDASQGSPLPASPPSAEPDRSPSPGAGAAPTPIAPAQKDTPKTERKTQTPQGFSLPGLADGAGGPQSQQGQQLIRVLFVLRPAEAAP